MSFRTKREKALRLAFGFIPMLCTFATIIFLSFTERFFLSNYLKILIEFPIDPVKRCLCNVVKVFPDD